MEPREFDLYQINEFVEYVKAFDKNPRAKRFKKLNFSDFRKQLDKERREWQMNRLRPS